MSFEQNKQSFTVAVYDSTLAYKFTARQVETAYFTRSWYSVGGFAIEINGSILDGLGTIVRGDIVQVNGNAYKAGVVTEIGREVGPSGKGSLKVIIQGIELKGLFKRRLIEPATGLATYDDTGDAESVMKALIDSQCGPGASAVRQFPGLTIAANQNRGDEYTLSARYDNLCDQLEAISQASDLGWFVTLDPNTLTMQFEVGVGLDRRGSQSTNSRAIFSTKFNTLQSARIQDTDANHATVCYAGGSGAGTGRDVELVFKGLTEPEGVERIEVFTDASDVETQAGVITRGESKLNELSETFLVNEAKILSYSPMKYQIDYDLGDVVTLHSYEVDTDIRLTEIKESWASAKYEIEIQFGRPYPTIMSQVGTLSKRATRAETLKESGNVNTGSKAAGGTLTPEAPVVSAIGIFKGTQLYWHLQADLLNPDGYEVQVSGDYDEAHPELASWWSLKLNGTDWKDVEDAVTPWSVTVLTHPDIPFGGTTEDPTGVQLWYRVRRKTLEPAYSDWSAVVTATTRTTQAGDLGKEVVYANNLVAGILQTVLAEISEMLMLDGNLGYGGQTDLDPVEGSLRWYLYKYGLRGERYDGAAWQPMVSIGDILNNTFQPFIRAMALIHTNMDASALDIGSAVPAGGVSYPFDNSLTPNVGTDVISTSEGLSYSSTVKKFGTHSLTSASVGRVKTTLTAAMASCGASLWVRFESSLKAAQVMVFGRAISTAHTGQGDTGAGNASDIACSADGLIIYRSRLAEHPVKTSDGGVTPSVEMTGPGSRNWRSVACSADGWYVILTSDDGTWTSDDGGDTWTEQTDVSADQRFNNVDCDGSGQIALAVDTSGNVWLSSNGGVTWAQQDLSGATASSVCVSHNGAALGAATSTYLWTKHGTGAWTQQSSPGSRTWKGISMNFDGSRIVGVNTTTQPYYSSDSGANWSAGTGASTNNNCVYSSFTGLNVVAFGSTAVYYYSSDGGATWAVSGAIAAAVTAAALTYDGLGHCWGIYFQFVESFGVVYASNSLIFYQRKTSSGVALARSVVLDVPDAEFVHVAVDSEGDGAHAAYNGDEVAAFGEVLATTAAFQLSVCFGMYADDILIMMTSAYSMADAIDHFAKQMKWAAVDLENDLYFASEERIIQDALEIHLRGDLFNASAEERLSWYLISPGAGWMDQKTTFTADRFTEASGGMELDFSPYIQAGTKAVLCAIQGATDPSSGCAVRPKGDTTYSSNTPFADSYFHTYIYNGPAGSNAWYTWAWIFLDDSGKAELAVDSATLDISVSKPFAGMRQ